MFPSPKLRGAPPPKLSFLRGAARGAPPGPPPINHDLISRAALAQQLGLCVHTLRAWERRGLGPPSIRIGRSVYYRAETVRRWLLDREAVSPVA